MKGRSCAGLKEGYIRVDGEATEGCQVKWKDDIVWDVLDVLVVSTVSENLKEFLSFSPKTMKY
jgi:hypothetical protein